MLQQQSQQTQAVPEETPSAVMQVATSNGSPAVQQIIVDNTQQVLVTQPRQLIVSQGQNQVVKQ